MAKRYDDLPDGVHRVERGLYIRKREGRPTVWLLIATVNGRRREVRLGNVDLMRISAARAAADKCRAMIAEGKDPVDEKRRAREKPAAKAPQYTLRDLYKEFMPVIERAKRWRNKKTGESWRHSLEAFALPIIGDRPVGEITRDDVLAVLRPIWDTKTHTALRVRLRLEALLNYAIINGKLAGVNPAAWRGNLSFFLPPPGQVQKPRHYAALSVGELRELLELVNWNNAPVGWLCVAFCALTACRVNEGARAKWSEIDLDARIWSCPRRKDGRDYPHRVPLSDQLLELLGKIPRVSEYVFPGEGSRRGSHIALNTAYNRIKLTAGHGTIHGLRSTFRDWAAENGVDRVLAEKSLMHSVGGAVEQAYQRSDLLEQRRPVMQAWADAIMPNRNPPGV